MSNQYQKQKVKWYEKGREDERRKIIDKIKKLIFDSKNEYKECSKIWLIEELEGITNEM